MGPEKTFETKIKNFIESERGWQVKFFANSYTKNGIPDILACVNGHFIGIEVKAENGKPSPLQIYHCEEIRKAGGFAFILYPSGFEDFKQFVYGLSCDEFTTEMPLILKGEKNGKNTKRRN